MDLDQLDLPPGSRGRIVVARVGAEEQPTCVIDKEISPLCCRRRIGIGGSRGLKMQRRRAWGRCVTWTATEPATVAEREVGASGRALTSNANEDFRVDVSLWGET